jgi:hypothetical protein
MFTGRVALYATKKFDNGLGKANRGLPFLIRQPPVACASGQSTFIALLSSKKLVFPPFTSVPTNSTVIFWPM